MEFTTKDKDKIDPKVKGTDQQRRSKIVELERRGTEASRNKRKGAELA